MKWHEGLWVGIYKGIEMQKVKIVGWNAKRFVCMYEGGKILIIESKETKNLYLFIFN